MKLFKNFTKKELEDLNRPMTEAEIQQQNKEMGWDEKDLALIAKVDSDEELTQQDLDDLEELESRSWKAITKKSG